MSDIIYVSPGKIIQLHAGRFHDKLRRLVASMQANGWTGRPVLALDMGDHLQALTGSHRIAAAIEAELDTIPVYAVSAADHVCGDDGDCEICGSECWVVAALEAGRDDDRLDAVRMSGDAEAISLMRKENEGE